MNERKTKKFCKKGGHYHFDKKIRTIAKKNMVHPYITQHMFGPHRICLFKIGTCLTCANCTDVMINWDGSPYACSCNHSNTHNGSEQRCKYYKLDEGLQFFKRQIVTSESPDSDMKRYIEERINNIKEEQKESKPLTKEEEAVINSNVFNRFAQETVSNEEIFDEFILSILDDSEQIDEIKKSIIKRPDIITKNGTINLFTVLTEKCKCFDIGSKYLIKINDNTVCVIVYDVTDNSVEFINATYSDGDGPIMAYEFSEDDKVICVKSIQKGSIINEETIKEET